MHTAPPSTPHPRPNPLVELPEPAGAVVDWAQAVLASHLHQDHFDAVAAGLIGDRLPVFCQPEDEAALRARGISGARPVAEDFAYASDSNTEWLSPDGLRAMLEAQGV